MIISVVGNAQSIFTKGNGELIDKADTVIRFNHGSTNAPKHQGSKIDVFVYSRFHQNVPNSPNVEIWHTLQPEFDEIRNDLWFNKLKAKPSNGIIVLEKLSRENKNDTVNIFGFDWKATKTWYKRNNKQPPPDPNPLGAHDFVKEKEYCLKLIEEFNWKLY